ncbi:hypothetical protein SLS56_001559 [Neofusicoccum ribis]|uniref:F-box domain protein n=1 Tax=Neofusicoccum ribis TaxID=45134 RepID=A0ABR3T8I1_9PEZI
MPGPHPASKPPLPPSPAAALPLELWMQILAQASADGESLPRLWFAARATSRQLRAAAEAMVPAAHLRGWLHVATFKIPWSRLAFDRLAAADKSRAVLRAEPWRGFEDSRQGGAAVERRGSVATTEAWRGFLGDVGAKGFGDHMVCLRSVVQDVEVVGWEVVGWGEGGFEVEVDWKGLLDRLFGEELVARRRGEVLARRFKRDRDAKWAHFGPSVLSGQLDFRTFEAILLGNENHRAYQNGYRDARRLRVERWLSSLEKDPKSLSALRKKHIDAEWVPNFRMNAVREKLESRMVESGEEKGPLPSALRRRALESDVPMKRELGELDEELLQILEEDEAEHAADEDVEEESPRWMEVGLLWKGKSPEEVAKLVKLSGREED